MHNSQAEKFKFIQLLVHCAYLESLGVLQIIQDYQGSLKKLIIVFSVNDLLKEKHLGTCFVYLEPISYVHINFKLFVLKKDRCKSKLYVPIPTFARHLFCKVTFDLIRPTVL